MARAQGCGIDLSECAEIWRDIRSFLAQNAARGRHHGTRVGVGVQHHTEVRSRALQQVHVDGWARRLFEAIFMGIADDSYYSEKVQVAIHIAELNGLAYWILMGPARTCKGFGN